jgi:predicted ribosomally synthesized peptide with nif11-like leader
MSISDAQEFLRQMASDPELAEEDAAAHRRQLVELAREKGFEVTEEDLAEAARAAQSEPFGAVDDAALEEVVGGAGRGQDIVNISFN